MDQEVKEYIEKEIFPLYERNDWGHQIWHIKGVIERSMHLAESFSVNNTMVYIIAAFHDIGCYINRENHEQISGDILSKDVFLLKKFTVDEINTMREAVEDHRGSLEQEPRSIYGKIIGTADRFTTIEGILRSMHCHTLQNHFSSSWSEMVQRSYKYLEKKYGKKGYAKIYIEDPAYTIFLNEVDYYLKQPLLFEKILRKMDTKIREEKHLPSLEINHIL